MVILERGGRAVMGSTIESADDEAQLVESRGDPAHAASRIDVHRFGRAWAHPTCCSDGDEWANLSIDGRPY